MQFGIVDDEKSSYIDTLIDLLKTTTESLETTLKQFERDGVKVIDDDMQYAMNSNQKKIVKNAITTLENVVQSVNPVRNIVSMITGKKISLNDKKANSSLVRAADFFKTKFKSGAISSIKTNTTNLKTKVINLFEQLNTLELNIDKDKSGKIFSDLNNIKDSIKQFTDLDDEPVGNYVSIDYSITNITTSTQEVKKALKLTTQIYNKFNITANAIEEIAKEKLNLKEIK